MSMLPDHPNVLRLLGACIQPPLMALVTPYCPKCATALIFKQPAQVHICELFDMMMLVQSREVDSCLLSCSGAHCMACSTPQPCSFPGHR